MASVRQRDSFLTMFQQERTCSNTGSRPTIRVAPRRMRDPVRFVSGKARVRAYTSILRERPLIDLGPSDLHANNPSTSSIVSWLIAIPPGGASACSRAARLMASPTTSCRLEPALAGRTDAEVFRWLRLDPRVERGDVPDSCETFRRYLREARAYHDSRKNSPRAGREHGCSIVRACEV